MTDGSGTGGTGDAGRTAGAEGERATGRHVSAETRADPDMPAPGDDVSAETRSRPDLDALRERVSAARAETEARGETFYPGPSRVHLASYPPRERWDEWVELDSRSWPERVERRYTLVPTTCFNCESGCGLLAYVDTETLQVRKLEGNPEHPGSRGRNCAKGPATLNQITDPDRILHPLKRAGERGEGRWERVSWDEALDEVAGRIRAAIVEDRANEVMYHVGRPGDDGFPNRVLENWGVDGHNSHTNICSSNARAGYQFWMGFDRPSPDHANADVILLVSSHLETGHYFNPHAQRVIEGKARGAKLIVFDVRLSNTATHADHWLATYPGSEPAVLLAIANHLIGNDLYDREFVRRWWNWKEYLQAERPGMDATFESFEAVLKELYADYTFEFAAGESGVDAATLEEVAEVVATAGTRLSTHNWRSAAAGNRGGWQVSRTLFLLNALLGAVATEGGTFPNGWNKFSPEPIRKPGRGPERWNELLWPRGYPLAMKEMSFLLPHLVRETDARLDVYFTRVYNPVWTNPDGFAWIEMLTDPERVGLHVALTPTWNESAYFADYVLPMGHASERHDLVSYEQYDGQWISLRQPVLRTARERLGERVDGNGGGHARGGSTRDAGPGVGRSGEGDAREAGPGETWGDTRDTNPGEVWEENEFWIELTWRIDPDGSLGIREFVESREHPGEKLGMDEYYAWIFENSVPGLPEKAAGEGLTPLEYMRRYGAFEVRKGVGRVHEREVPAGELEDVATDALGRVYSRAEGATGPVGGGPLDGDGQGRKRAGVEVDGVVRRGFPTPSGRLEFWSRTLAEWGWPEAAIPTYLPSHVHREALEDGQMPLISTFRLPVHIHTRSHNSKWLDEIAHTNPLWIHPSDARRLDVTTGDLVRVSTEIGHFVVKAWVTEGIRPGVVACSHHMGRWKPSTQGSEAQRQAMATVDVEREGDRWGLRRRREGGPYASDDPDTARIWWTDVGVHQNLTFPVHPDPLSGMHCWHQAVRVTQAERGDRYGEVFVDAARSRAAWERWRELCRPADVHSPDGTRRPWWMPRPVRPRREAYRL